jgi:uncharacterized repeat protein (TIGR03803 family)
LIMDSSGNLYGTTVEGGANVDGTVFELAKGSSTLTVLASFNGSNGKNPYGDLMLSGNTLYGTTTEGGAYGGQFIGGLGGGTVFSVPVTGGTQTVLASLTGSAGEISYNSGVILVGSTLYGTTSPGGDNDYGAVFSVPVTGGTPTLLASFDDVTNGREPNADLTLSADGNTLYGTAVQGGDDEDGTVFSLPLTGGALTVLASFDGSNGKYSYADLTLSGNMLYGTTEYGGDNNNGTVFELTLPEPASIGIVGAGMMGLLARRRSVHKSPGARGHGSAHLSH